MSEINDGGPAFPVADYDHQTFAPKNIEETRRLLSGMSLRDYFAAKVLPSIYGDSLGGPDWRDAVADAAYQLADAMLKAREKGAGS